MSIKTILTLITILVVFLHAEKNNSSSIKILSPFDNTNINEKKSGGVNIQCSFHGCNLSFKSPDKMKLHLKNAHGIRLFECVSKPKNPIEKSAPVEETLTLHTLEDTRRMLTVFNQFLI